MISAAYDNEIVGAFAYKSMTEVVCNGEACIIAGSRKKMKQYIKNHCPFDIKEIAEIKNTTYGEIKRGMSLGGIYDFDEDAFNRFKQIASKDELNFQNFGPDLHKQQQEGIKLFRVLFMGKKETKGMLGNFISRFNPFLRKA